MAWRQAPHLSILREASIRLAGWLYGNRPHLAAESFKDPSGTEFAMTFNNSAATANGLRASGAGALLSRYVVRRGGAISREAESSGRLIMWPFQKSEKRQAVGGGYTEAVSTLIYAQAVGTAQNASTTAALESVAGMLSRTFASAEVLAAPEIVRAVSPRCLGQIGRDLVRVGESASRHPAYGRPPDVGPALQLGIGKAARTRRRGPAPRLVTGQADRQRGAYRKNRSFMLPGEARPPGHIMAWGQRPGLPTLQD